VKIVCMYGDNPLASWMLSRGLPAVLRRMGHEVIEIPTLGTAQVKRSDIERINKPITPDVDLVIVSGPEYLMSWIKTFYPQWKSLKCAKVCWYHESEERDDRIADFSAIAPWFDFNFMPNPRDAAKHNAVHLPIGVDTEMFSADGRPRKLDVAFIGTLYDKRKAFLSAMMPKLAAVKVHVGNALVQDLEGINLVKSVRLLADEYRRIRILLNLPTLSNVLVSKVLEATACGCLVLTPEPRHADIGAGYEPNPAMLADKIRWYLERPEKCDRDAETYRQRVLKEHRMELRLEKIFATCGLGLAAGVNQVG
jgi:Glycosyl transferases group 1